MNRIALALVTLAATHVMVAGRPGIHDIRTLAGSCTNRMIPACDVDLAGALESGDCLFGDGSRYDIWDFHGTKGQIIEVVVRPLAATYTKPWVVLVPPASDPLDPPVISGGAGGVTLRYQLSSTGPWRIAVSSDDVFAGGDYVMHFYCAVDTSPGEAAGCVRQDLLCGQGASWSLNAESCRFSNAPRAFAGWQVYAVAGDFLTFEQTSVGFEPLFGLYRNRALLKSSTREHTRKHTMRHFVEQSGWYEFLTTSVEDNRGGDIEVSLSCSRSGCTFPYLVGPVPTTVTEYGTSAVVPFNANAVGGFVATLRQDFEPLATSTTSSIVTPPIRSLQKYVLDLENPCGRWTSDPFLVLPDRNTRRRAIRK